MNEYLIIAFGFIAPILFFARTIIQWYKSEKENKVNSPVIYWQISLIGSIILLIYGILRNDFAIILGQFIVYPIYIRNLQLKLVWDKMRLLSQIIILSLPLICLLWIFWAGSNNWHSITNNSDITGSLMAWGVAAQVVFTFRFVTQWVYSEKKKDSVLPLAFWVISIIGSVMIISYAILRLDPVFFLAHILGLFMYVRNIFLHFGKKSIFQMDFLKKININKIDNEKTNSTN